MKYTAIKNLEIDKEINYQDKWLRVSSLEKVNNGYHIITKQNENRVDLVLSGDLLILTK